MPEYVFGLETGNGLDDCLIIYRRGRVRLKAEQEAEERHKQSHDLVAESVKRELAKSMFFFSMSIVPLKPTLFH